MKLLDATTSLNCYILSTNINRKTKFMKTFKFVLLLLISLLSINSFAQKNEIKAMYSPLSLQRIDGWGRDFDYLSGKYTGAFMVEYNRYMKPRLKLGVSVGYDQKTLAGTRTDVFINQHPPYGTTTTTIHQTNKEAWLFFGPQLGYDYIQKDNFRLGSLVGVYLVLTNYEDIVDSRISKGTDLDLFFHAEVVNFTWGKTNGLTGQLGYGNKGLFSLGYFVRW